MHFCHEFYSSCRNSECRHFLIYFLTKQLKCQSKTCQNITCFLQLPMKMAQNVQKRSLWLEESYVAALISDLNLTQVWFYFIQLFFICHLSRPRYARTVNAKCLEFGPPNYGIHSFWCGGVESWSNPDTRVTPTYLDKTEAGWL